MFRKKVSQFGNSFPVLLEIDLGEGVMDWVTMPERGKPGEGLK
jgi:hypothetical protein